MALTPGEANLISNTSRAAKILLDEFYAIETQNNQLYAGAADLDTTITQGDLDSVPSFGGLTTTQLADASFALATILGTINSALQALTVLARLP